MVGAACGVRANGDVLRPGIGALKVFGAGGKFQCKFQATLRVRRTRQLSGGYSMGVIFVLYLYIPIWVI